MKIGFTAAYTYAYKGTSMGLSDYLESIKTIGSMGVKYFDLEILQENHVAIYSDKHIDMILKQCRECGVSIAGFSAWACLELLHTNDPEKHNKCFDLFKSISRIATELGATYIHLGSDMIDAFIVSRDDTYVTAPANAIHIPEEIDFKTVEQTYAQNLHTLATIAADHNLKFALEPRANSLVSGADSFLNTCSRVNHPNLFCCLDIMHCSFHREHIPVAIEKLGEKLLVFQMCDSARGKMTHLPLGHGEMPTDSILKTLEKINFDGYIMLEIYSDGKCEKSVVDDWYEKSMRFIKPGFFSEVQQKVTPKTPLRANL